ncbi:MAG: DUF6443 domain-containing protein [Bacteroides sp.]|nr:DUF6443 domain-containing protein [Bacteroides sp.]
MKRYIYFYMLSIILSVTLQAQISTDQNYIHTTVPTVPVSSVSNLSTSQSLQTVQYFDGLGRLFQTVQRDISPSLQDLTDYQEYDGSGKISRSWLPVNISSNQGAMVELSQVESQASIAYKGDRRPFYSNTYERSSLFRLTSTLGPGEYWDYPVQEYVYGSNIAGDNIRGCLHYIAVSSATDTLVTIMLDGEFDPGELYYAHVTDNGYYSYEFEDKRGRKVMKRVSLGVYAYGCTYYIYDDFDRLIAVLPPMASDAMTVGSLWSSKTSTVLQQYAYLYQYDAAGRCIGKKLPGASWIFYIYDQAGRLIFIQDGESRLRGEWVFTIPDAMGRIVLMGICRNTISHTSSPFANALVKATWDKSSSYMGYSVSGVELLSPVVLSANYFDQYEFMGINHMPDSTDVDFRYEAVTGYGQRAGGYQGLLTGTWNRALEDTSCEIYSVMYYDYRGRLIQTKSNNHLAGGREKFYLKYNFVGLPVNSKHIHSATGQATLTEYYTYNYDHGMRPQETRYQLAVDQTTYPETLLSVRAYNELTQLGSLTMNNSSEFRSDYTYNIRSDIHTIDGELYKETIYRAEPDNHYWTEDIRGNVAAVEWKVANESAWRLYDYFYDQNQLQRAEYSEGQSALLNQGRFNENTTYDLNGNILTLQRYGKTSATTYGLTEDLTPTYTGNQLSTVTNHAGNPLQRSTYTFRYDTNGNLTCDTSRNIAEIQYNILNLPDNLRFVNGHSLGYMYTSDGIKRSVVRTAGDSSSVTDYCGNLLYHNGSLSMVFNEVGYVTLSGTTPVYHYFLKDYQGNVRVVADAHGNIEQVNHYYPYGGLFGEGTSVADQPYRYGMKELDDTQDMNTYDFSARFLHSSLNRFTTMDPLAEKYYEWTPYAYGANNPLRYVDPTGEDWYEDKYGNVRWEEGNEEIEGYANVGSSYSVEFGDGEYLNYYQNALISTSQAPKNAFLTIAENPELQNELLGPNSPLLDYSQSRLFNGLVNQMTSPIGRDIGRAALTVEATVSGVQSLASLWQFARLIYAVRGITVTANGIRIQSLTEHGLIRMAQRGVSQVAVKDALTNPLKINPVKTQDGLSSQKFIGRQASVVINPTNGKIITVHPTSTSRVRSLLKEN